MLQISPIEIARQITLIEHDLLRRVRHSEFLRCKWDDPRHSPNIVVILHWSRILTSWIKTEVVKRDNTEGKPSFFLCGVIVADSCLFPLCIF